MAYSAALAPTNCQCTLIEATANDALDEPELQISRLKANFSWTAPHGKHRFLYQHRDRLSCQRDADSDGLGDNQSFPVLLPIFGQGHWHTATKKDQGTTS